MRFMLKKGKKILAALFALVLALAVFAACGADYTSDPLTGDTSGEVVSNGGFVVEKGNYIYFVNGVEDYTADNTYGAPVKGTLMRISKEDLSAGEYSAAEIVVPQLLVSQDYTSGFYIYGDRVYYASPTTARNPDGDVENSYIDFKSSALDGSSTMSGYYVRMSDNTTVYRYVQNEDGTVYLLYVDSSNLEIHSYNTATDENVTLVAGYQDYVLNSDDPTDPYVYYTMSVVKNYGYSESQASSEPYQQLYRASAFTAESPYDMDLSENYTDKETGEVLDYVNVGTLILDGIGRGNQVTPFNHGMTEGITPYYEGTTGVTYTLVKYTNGGLYYTNSEISSSSILYRLPAASLDAALAAGTWNSVTGNANNQTGASGDINERIAVGTSQAGESALFFEHNGAQYYIYAEGTNIVRVRSDASAAAYKGEEVYIARNLSSSSSDDSSDSSDSSSDTTATSATLLYIQDGYLYFTQSDSGIYRVNCLGTREQYANLDRADDYKPTRYLEISYSSEWYVPEIVNGYLFFANAGTYADSYVYVMANPADNAALIALNEKYEDVQEVLSDISATYSAAGNAANYYYYTQDAAILDNEDYAENFTAEDNDVFDAFVNCTAYGNAFDASVLKDDGGAWNHESYFYALLGRMSDEDADTIADSLISAFIDTSSDTADTSGGWTWQWAAIFVPVGVVVIAAAVVTVVLVRKKKSKARK